MTVVEALARGIAGLVNAHDPDVVTLGALSVDLRAAATGELVDLLLLDRLWDAAATS